MLSYNINDWHKPIKTLAFLLNAIHHCVTQMSRIFTARRNVELDVSLSVGERAQPQSLFFSDTDSVKEREKA